MSKANINTLSSILMAPVTVVFIVIIGIVITQKLNIPENYKPIIIIIAFFIGVIIGGLEIVHGYNRMPKHLENDFSETYREKVRQMVINVFDEDFEEQ